MIVSHSKKFIFISNPKTGSTSIDVALSEFNDEPHLNEIIENGFFTQKHMPAQVLKYMLPANAWDDYFKFAFVRNPWDWFISQHCYNLTKNGITFDINAKLSKTQIIETYNFLKSYRGKIGADSAFQHSFLYSDENKVLIDFIGRFEKIENDFREIQEIIKTNLSLPHLNSSKHRHYQYYFDDETKAMITELYKVDVELFCYNF